MESIGRRLTSVCNVMLVRYPGMGCQLSACSAAIREIVAEPKQGCGSISECMPTNDDEIGSKESGKVEGSLKCR